MFFIFKTLQTICLILKAKEDKRDEKCNLVICPLVALTQWKFEIEKYTKNNALSILIYYGNNRTKDPEDFKKYDVVITSYNIIEVEYRKQQKGMKRNGNVVKTPSILHSVHWNRVVLDEGHSIKTRTSSTAYAVFALESTYRWSLTGTPLQNRIGELFSLIRFLRVTPFSYYYCKKCPCRKLSWTFTKGEGCNECHHSPMSHFSWWNRFILNPIKRWGLSHFNSNKALRILKRVLQRVMLRRTKEEKAADLNLPPRIIHMRHEELNTEENDFYEALYTQSQTRFDSFVSEGTILNNYAHVFDLLLRLRQAVNHPYLVLYAKDRHLQESGIDWCSLCKEPADDPVISKCKVGNNFKIFLNFEFFFL